MVEAVLEDMPLKQKIFGEIEKHVRPDTILASNTSVMPITQIMQGCATACALKAPIVNSAPGAALSRAIGVEWTFSQPRSTSP